MATTVHRPTRTTWHAATSGPAFAPRPGRRIVVHRRTRPAPDWLWGRLDRIPWYLPPAVPALTDREALDMFDQDARRTLGISGREFLRRWDSGVYNDASDTDPEGRRVLHVASFIPFISTDDLRS